MTRLAGGARANVAFLDRVDQVCAPLEASDLGVLSLQEQVAVYRKLEEDVLEHWTAPIVNDTRCMIAFGFLKSLTERWIGVDGSDEAVSLQNDLLCGEGDLKSTEPMRLLLEIAREVEGDLELQVPDGQFSVAASNGIGLVSKSQVSVVSAEVKVNAVEANVALQKATLVGKYLQTEFDRIKSFATSFDGVFERFSQKAKNAYRRVDGLDQLKAEHVDHSAKKTMNLHGENAVMTARQLVKVDGEQIHMG